MDNPVGGGGYEQTTKRDNRIHTDQNDVESYIRDELTNGDPNVVLRRIAERSERGWKLIREMFQVKLEECRDDIAKLKKLASLMGINKSDWFCPSCNNKNYWFRKHCNMRTCRAYKPVEIFGPKRREQEFGRGRGFGEPGLWHDDMKRRDLDWPPVRKRPFPDDGFRGGKNKRFREDDWNNGRRSDFGPEREMWPGDGVYKYRPEIDSWRGDMRDNFIPGEDWICAKCGNRNYANRKECNMRKCNEKRPDMKRGEGKQDEWKCPECQAFNFPSRRTCRACKKRNPNVISKGDWTCPKCSYVNFGNRAVCDKSDCDEPRPPPKNGDWICPLCQNLNFKTREVCNMRSCGAPRPKAQNIW